GVTSYLPRANDRSETVCCGASSETDPGVAPWLTAHDFSAADDPMVKLPAGITTISGQSLQSRNTAPGSLLGAAAGTLTSAPLNKRAVRNITSTATITNSFCI